VIFFLLVGLVGTVLLLVSLVADGVLDGLDIGGDGFISGPSIAAFTATFGFGGALAVYMDATPAVAVLVGVGTGGVLGGFTGLVARSMMKMPTDATPTTADLHGCSGTVITTIAPGASGEVSVLLGGQPVKVSARSDDTAALATGTAVEVTAVLSPTFVNVRRTS
jgi:hypothetical protein